MIIIMLWKGFRTEHNLPPLSHTPHTSCSGSLLSRRAPGKHKNVSHLYNLWPTHWAILLLPRAAVKLKKLDPRDKRQWEGRNYNYFLKRWWPCVCVARRLAKHLIKTYFEPRGERDGIQKGKSSYFLRKSHNNK